MEQLTVRKQKMVVDIRAIYVSNITSCFYQSLKCCHHSFLLVTFTRRMKSLRSAA